MADIVYILVVATRSQKAKVKSVDVVSEPVVPFFAPSTSLRATEGKESKWVTVGWVLLLIGGLAHMLPEQMAPVLKYAAWGVSVQMAVGVLSVVMALYYLLGE